MQPAPDTRLDSWKEIAEYLGRNVRTVTRWADERGMPVHHVPGKKRGAVFAFREEIDTWLRQNEEAGAEHHENGAANEAHPRALTEGAQESAAGRNARSWQRVAWRIALPVFGVAIAVAAISAVLHPMANKGDQLASLKYGASAIEGQTADGRTLWVHKYPQDSSKYFLATGKDPRNSFRISDFFGDGTKQAAAVVPLWSGPNASDIEFPQVDFFTSAGKLLWSYVPDRTFRFGDHELKGPWHVEDLLVTEGSGRRTLWAAMDHHMWGNSFVAEFDARTGKDTMRFVNTGNVHRMCEAKTTHGAYLLLGGFNNEWDSGSLAIVKEDRPFAVSPQSPGSRHHCDSCPPGDPDYYFVFPRTEINRTLGAYEDSVYDIFVSEDGIEVEKHEGFGGEHENTVYLMEREPPFSPISLRYNSDYEMVHRKWSAEGKLGHPLESCPERLHPLPVRLWTPTDGWRDIPIKPAKANQ